MNLRVRSIACLAAIAIAAPVVFDRSVEAADKAARDSKKTSRDKKKEPRTIVKSEVPLSELIELNAQSLFGTDRVKLEGDQLEVVFYKDGQIAEGFEGKGIMDSQHPKMAGAQRKFIQFGDQKGGEKLLPGLCAIGMGQGVWISKFRMASDTKIHFDVRFPNLLTRQSVLKVRLNLDKRRSGYETSFFNSIGKVLRGRSRGAKSTKLRSYRAHASSWFPRKGEAVPVEFAIEDGSLVSRVSKKALVKTKAKDKGGRVGLLFSKVLFTLQNFTVSGKLDEEWCQAELAKLEEEGKLVEKDPKASPPKYPEENADEPEGGGDLDEGDDAEDPEDDSDAPATKDDPDSLALP